VSVAVAPARMVDAKAEVGPFDGDAVALAGRHPVSPSDATAAVTVPATTNETRTRYMILVSMSRWPLSSGNTPGRSDTPATIR
jgi:hypothetical protein